MDPLSDSDSDDDSDSSPEASDHRFYRVDWSTRLEERWPAFFELGRRMERGQSVVKGLGNFLLKRAQLEDTIAGEMKKLLGDSSMSAASVAAASLTSASSWFSSAPVEKKKLTASSQTLPAESEFAKEDTTTLRESLLSVLVVQSHRQSGTHARQCHELQLLAQRALEAVKLGASNH